jgi:hypothetical protein
MARQVELDQHRQSAASRNHRAATCAATRPAASALAASADIPRLVADHRLRVSPTSLRHPKVGP